MSILQEHNIQFYCLKNNSYLAEQHMHLRQDIFQLWSTEWRELYKSLGSPKLPGLPDFLSYQYFNCITLDNKVAAICGHKFLHLQDPLNSDSEYLQGLGPEYVRILQDLDLQRVMTFESFLVAPEFRKIVTKISLGKVLAYLANKLFSETSAQAVIAAARRETKVPQMATEIGYDIIESAKKVRVFECDLVVQRHKTLLYPEDPAWHMSEELWNKRVIIDGTDYRAAINNQETKKAI